MKLKLFAGVISVAALLLAGVSAHRAAEEPKAVPTVPAPAVAPAPVPAPTPVIAPAPPYAIFLAHDPEEEGDEGEDRAWDLLDHFEDEEEDVLIPAPGHGPRAFGLQAMPFAPGRGPMAMAFRAKDRGSRLGVRVDDLDAEKVKELKLTSENGALVKGLREESPAAKAGLKKDDVIVEFAGEKVRSAAQLQRLVRETPAGRSATIVVSRAGQTQTLTAKLEAKRDETFTFRARAPHPMPEPPEFEIPEFNFQFGKPGARLGITADELTAQLAEYFGVKQGKGVLVREVLVGSPAAKAGLKAGDVIVRVDEQDVATVRELRRALNRAGEEKQKLSLTLVRNRQEQTLSVEVEPPSRGNTRQTAMLIKQEVLEGVRRELQAHQAQLQKAKLLLQEKKQLLQKKLQAAQQNLRKELQGLKEKLTQGAQEEI